MGAVSPGERLKQSQTFPNAISPSPRILLVAAHPLDPLDPVTLRFVGLLLPGQNLLAGGRRRLVLEGRLGRLGRSECRLVQASRLLLAWLPGLGRGAARALAAGQQQAR